MSEKKTAGKVSLSKTSDAAKPGALNNKGRLQPKAKPKKKAKPQDPPVIVRRINGSGEAENKRLLSSAAETPAAVNRAFDCGPPPELNSMKRLAKEVNSVAIDLETAQNDPVAVGRDLVKGKGGEDFRQAASKKVDYDGEAQLFSSLANLSVASSSFSSDVPLAPTNPGCKRKDPELRLEDYFTPYQGTDVFYTPQDKFAILDLVSSQKKRGHHHMEGYKIQDVLDPL